ncbi:plasmid pRiA4b ORF-3 family protein [Corallococcus exiguus]|nr:plasmid pRiA4b ORF-3 family protein [Corallococcus exiguus]RKH80122.1 plasmid pRiA4b ORF-3 family protein [Corallococcus sp. AB032C]RUO89494.1 plasmid pRiA4b ORF-3 family protein [Corallococcus sp. AB018]NNB97078.1 plasmid pRiA4b ORF-3 family protein [Corallococcus exiguus]NNC03087.1 plasmid pRiA4b ORF-3 family protein [Corallococcus exiguus]
MKGMEKRTPLMATRKKTAATPSIHVLHVELVDIAPAVWRELQVRSDTPLSKLHDILQASFGWTNSHMHLFEDSSRQQYGDLVDGGADDFSLGGPPLLDERKYTVADLGPRARSVFGYIYDFGDDWVHRIRVKKVQPPEAGKRYPTCTAGARAAPPDDCGGVPGYEDLLEALQDPEHEDHDELLEWVGGSFDPEAFDLKATDKAIRTIK